MPADRFASTAFLAFLIISLGFVGTLCAALKIPTRWRNWRKQFKPVKVNRKECRWK